GGARAPQGRGGVSEPLPESRLRSRRGVHSPAARPSRDEDRLSFPLRTLRDRAAGLRSARYGGVLGSSHTPGRGDLRGGATGDQRARPRARLLCTDGRLQPRHPSLRPRADRRRGRWRVSGEPDPLSPHRSPPRVRVRWNIFLYLFGFGFVAYFQQRGLTVASYDMMPHLHLTQMQISWLLWWMLLGYTALQFPGGVIGQRIGARWMFVIISLIAFAATVSTPLAPIFLTGTALYAALLAAQLLLGSSQGPIFPVSAGVFEAWFPSRQWPLVQGLQSMGLQLGAALT